MSSGLARSRSGIPAWADLAANYPYVAFTCPTIPTSAPSVPRAKRSRVATSISRVLANL